MDSTVIAEFTTSIMNIGFMAVASGVALWVLHSGVSWIRTHLSNLEANIERERKNQQDVQEHLLALAKQVSCPSKAGRVNELTNGGPRATTDEVLMNVILLGESIDRMSGRIERNEGTLGNLTKITTGMKGDIDALFELLAEKQTQEGM